MHRPRLSVSSVLFAISIGLASCAGRGEAPQEIVVFHAGSLSVPFIEIAAAFEGAHPGTRVVREAAGSRTSARKISDLGRACDVFASADYRVIEDLLEPDHVSWHIPFARNEICLAYRAGAMKSAQLEEGAWLEVLIRDDVAYARSDPDSDPCGYRTVQVLELAETHYQKPGFAAPILAKDSNFVRPKGSDLISLLETGSVDYAFVYRSVALQHGLEFLRLPEAINLGDPASDYSSATASISGKTPDTRTTDIARPILYSLTIPQNAPNPVGAASFVEFVLSEDQGLAILKKHHQMPAVPSPARNWGEIPETLKRFARPRSASFQP